MMEEKDLNKYKEALLAQRQVLVDRLDAITKDKARQSGPVSADFADQATESENNEVIDHLDVLERKELSKIDGALFRIEAGTFGQCLECGANISEKRLGAVAYAELCINCASEA